jgi:hypothetical protein
MNDDGSPNQNTVNFAADEIRRLLMELCLVGRMAPGPVLAGMQLELAVAMAHLIGGPRAALELEKAADSVRHLPSAQAQALAYVQTAGRA